jgi:hypothetical protein
MSYTIEVTFHQARHVSEYKYIFPKYAIPATPLDPTSFSLVDIPTSCCFMSRDRALLWLNSLAHADNMLLHTITIREWVQ